MNTINAVIQDHIANGKITTGTIPTALYASIPKTRMGRLIYRSGPLSTSDILVRFFLQNEFPAAHFFWRNGPVVVNCLDCRHHG